MVNVIPRVQHETAPSSAEIMAQYDAMTTVSPSALTRGAYDIYVIQTLTGRIFDLSPFHVQTKISQDFKTAFTSMDIVFKGEIQLRDYLVPGNWIILYGPYYNNVDLRKSFVPAPSSERNQNVMAKDRYSEIERGQIVDAEQQLGPDGQWLIHARDPSWLLAKNKIPVMIPEGTATDRLRFWENKGLIKLDGNLTETTHQLSATRSGKRSIWEEIQLDLAETNKVEDKRYVLRHRSGKFFIQEISVQQRMWSFEVGNNIFELAHRQSIQDYANVVYVTNNQETSDSVLSEFSAENDDAENNESLEIPYTGFAILEDDIPRFGTHILVQEQEQVDIEYTGQQQAENLLKKFGKIQETALLETYGMAGIHWGDQVLIYAHDAEMSGVYWVRAVQHIIKDGETTMTLDIDFDYVISEDLRQSEESDVNILWESSGDDIPESEALP